MNEIIIASTTTIDRLDKVYILFNSIKKTKSPETKITYYLFVKNKDINYCIDYFKSTISTDFYVVVSDLDIFASYVNTPISPFNCVRNHLYYAKCLFPSYFTQYSKLLYLDVDIVFISKGIEDLWNENIEDYYIGACIDPTYHHCSLFNFDLKNTKTKNYFNAGVILFNLDRIRKEGKANELKHWCSHWDLKQLVCFCYDQTLLNYILREKSTIINFKYNNSLLSCLGIAKDAYTYYLNSIGYEKPEDSLKDAVILHFCGANKPWEYHTIKDSDFPYKKEAVEIWSIITVDTLNSLKKKG